MEKEIEQFFTAIQDDHQRLDVKVDKLEEKMNKGFREVREEMDLRFRAVDDRFEKLDFKVDRGFAKVDEKLDRLNDNVQVIAVIMREQKIVTNNLDKRVGNLEKSRI